MALGLRHWLGLVAAGCAAVALWALPPSSWEDPYRQPRLQEEARERALLDEVVFANAKLQRTRWADSLTALTLASDGPLTMGFPANASPAEVELVRSRALDEFEAVEARADVVLGIFYVTHRDGEYPSAPQGYGNSNGEYYFGEQDGRTYCFSLQPVWRMQGGRVRLGGLSNFQTRLGICQFVARFGLPGPAVADWLAHGGTSMATTLERSTDNSVGFATAWGEDFQRRGYLGLPSRRGYYGFAMLPLEQCFAGMSQGCAQLLLEPHRGAGYRMYDPYQNRGRSVYRLVEESPLAAVQALSPLDPSARFLAGDLIAQFGADRFQRWWTSEEPLDASFRDAFGVEPGTWHQERVARLVPVSPPGPGVTWNGLLGVLGFLAAAAFVGGGWARRRKVA